MIIKSPAKINLSLDVTGKRSNGYHDVEMIMQSVSLCDEIYIAKADKIEVSTNLPYVPNDNRNIAYRAAQAFFEASGIDGGALIKIKKNIPVGAGLGGGSSNAASVLIALNELYGAGLSTEQFEKIGIGLGADVPFFFTGGTCLAQGLGEVLTPILPGAKGWTVIVKPLFSVGTKWVYENLALSEIRSRPGTNLLISAIKSNDIRKMAQNMENVLECVTSKRYHQIHQIKLRLMEEGALGSIMSGSGSSVFGVFDVDNEKAARKCAARMRKKYESVFTASFL